jgi:glycosyltransferase involved in cell wall biosynthesis
MKIAVIGSGELETPQVGGSIRKFAFRPAKGLYLLDHEVHFFDSANPHQSLLDTNHPKLHTHRISYPNFQLFRSANPIVAAIGAHLNMLAFSISLFFSLGRSLRKERFDVIQVNTRYDAIAVIALQRLLGSHIPVVFTCHNSDWGRERLPLFLRLFFLPEVLAIKKSTMVVTVSQRQRSGILKRISIKPEKVKVLYQGVDKGLFQPRVAREANGPYILCVSDILERKNQLVLVKAMPEILKHFSACRLVLIGGIRDNAYLANINRISEQLGISGSIDIKGKVPFKELLAWIHRADVCLVPTQREGFATVLLEMLACKKAVVASKIPEIMELNSIAGQDIFATASPYEPNEWSAKIIELLQDDGKRHKYEEAADSVVVGQVEEARRYMHVYDELMIGNTSV